MGNRSIRLCRQAAARVIVFVLLAGISGRTLGKGATYRYEEGQPVNAMIRTHEVSISDARGDLYAYASFNGVESNPGWYERDEPRGQQVLIIGKRKGDRFSPAVQFGIANNKDFFQSPEGVARRTFLTPWLSQGGLNYYGDYLRPRTPCDFKLRINLEESRAAVWYSSRGDDHWRLLAENVPLISSNDSINHVRIQQSPGAPGVADVVIRSEPWPEGEKVKPYPLGKKDGIVALGNGFHFQSMRSTWHAPGRHVEIIRQPLRWFGFPEVAQTAAGELVVAHNDGLSHGGGGGLFVRRSKDLGRTWDEVIQVYPAGVNCPRVQRLRDGTLLLMSDVEGGSRVVFYDSRDGGRTWTNQRFLDREHGVVGNEVFVPSRVVELTDGSWVVATSAWMDTTHTVSLLQVYRSENRGLDWKLISVVPGGAVHSPDEGSIVRLQDGRLIIFARQSRNDGFPALAACSKDGGKTWTTRELPFSITGRPAAGLIRDGRGMVTFRSHIGRASLWAWIGYPDDESVLRAQGIHYNDSRTVALKDHTLHIDNDGTQGQFTQYFLRPPDSRHSSVEMEAEVKVGSNSGRAASLSIPFAGKLRIFPGHAQMAHDPSLRIAVRPGQFHIFRAVSATGRMKLFVDGKLAWETPNVDSRPPGAQGTYRAPSLYAPAFGNEGEGGGYWGRETQWPDVYPENITPEATGYSQWRRITLRLSDPVGGKHVTSWSAQTDGFPDQYQLDHIIEVEASSTGADQGYSGWTELEDGRIYVVNYTDDTAPPCIGTGQRRRERLAKNEPVRAQTEPFRDGIAWIRGTYLLPGDLPLDLRMPVR